jgi:hypothetical protein
MGSEGKRVELGEALACLSAAFREWDEGPARGTVLEHEARRQEVWRSARLVTAAWRKGEGKREPREMDGEGLREIESGLPVAERLERAVERLRDRQDAYAGLLRCAVDEFLEVWDEAVAEGRPALVGEDAEAPVCGGATDAFDVAPSDAPCPVPPKPEPECCTEEPKVCPLYPDCPEDCVTVFGTRCSLTDQLQRLWRGISGNRTIIDAMSRKLDRLDKGLADLKKLVEEHIAL